MQAQTRQRSFGRRVTMASAIAALALSVGFGAIADHASAFGLPRWDAAFGIGRPATQVPARHHSAVAHSGGGGGTLATRR
jgi:hypothetical protein